MCLVNGEGRGSHFHHMSAKVTKHYSGPASVELWNRIGQINNPCLRSAVYVFGCALQEVETRFWQALTDAEIDTRIKPTRIVGEEAQK